MMQAFFDATALVVFVGMVLMIGGFECNIFLAKRRHAAGKLRVSREVLNKNLALMRQLQKGIFASGTLLLAAGWLLRTMAG